MKKAICLFLILLFAACGNNKTASLSSDATTQSASLKITAQSILANVEKGRYAAGELLVKFKPGVTKAQSLKTHQSLGASVVRQYSFFPNLQHIKLPAGLAVKDAIVKYMSDPNIEYAEPNYIRRISMVPNDTYFNQQWALQNTGSFAGGTAGADIKAPAAWDILFPSNENNIGKGNIVIAILDTGIDLSHPDLVPNINSQGQDFTTCAQFSSVITSSPSLAGTQEVPPVATSATGTADLTIDLDTGAISGSVAFNGISSSATAADISQGAIGTNGPVVISLVGAGGTSGTWTVPAGAVLSANQLIALLENNLYVNIHSNANPGGEIRGQIIFPGLSCLTPSSPGGAPVDDNGHGTHVSGIIGAVGNNSLGISGVLWHVGLLAVKFLNVNGEGSVSDEINAIDYLLTLNTQGMNIKVVNASFGSNIFSQSEYLALSGLNNAQILVMAAAGNESANNDLIPFYPANYSNPNDPNLINSQLSALDNIISVAATDQNDRLASFSNFGPTSVHVAAPGVYVLSTVPVTGVDFSFQSLCSGSYYAGYDFCAGTSMAAPHVSGLAGLLYSFYDGQSSYNNLTANPQFNYSQIRSTILRYVDNAGDSPNLVTLNGSIQTKGRINAYKALASLLPPTGLTATASTSQITLTWTDNATGDPADPSFPQYAVERQGPSDANFVDITSGSHLPPNTTTFTDTTVIPTTPYQYRVRTVNFVAESSPSNTTPPIAASGTPPPPTGGGGGCSIGARQNSPTAVADFAILLMPLLFIMIVRRRR